KSRTASRGPRWTASRSRGSRIESSGPNRQTDREPASNSSVGRRLQLPPEAGRGFGGLRRGGGHSRRRQDDEDYQAGQQRGPDAEHEGRRGGDRERLVDAVDDGGDQRLDLCAGLLRDAGEDFRSQVAHTTEV